MTRIKELKKCAGEVKEKKGDTTYCVMRLPKATIEIMEVCVKK